jgi:hypothetical protein
MFSAVFLAGTGSAQEICDEAHPIAANTTVQCSLLVPPDQTCELTGVQVTGNIIVQAGATLIAGPGTQPSSVGGNVSASAAACVSLNVSSVGGNVIASGTGSCSGSSQFDFLCTPRVGGNVEILGSSQAWCVAGNPNCGCSYSSMTVGGNFEFEGNAIAEYIENDVIRGNLTFNSNHGGGLISKDTIGGNLYYNSNSGGSNSVSNNGIGGNLQFNSNTTGPNTVSDNHAGGNIQCFSNNPTPNATGNTAGGVISGQCKPADPSSTSGVNTTQPWWQNRW